MIVCSGRSGRRREAQGSGDAGMAGRASWSNWPRACLPRPRAEQPFGRGNDSRSGDPGCRRGGYRVPRDRRAVTTCNEPHVPGAAESGARQQPVPADRSRRGGHHHVIVNIVGGYCSASSARRFEQGGDFSDGFGTWADVPHRGARVPVPGLGHDQLQRDVLLATGESLRSGGAGAAATRCAGVNRIRARS